jgi:hypothetical protein
MTIPLALFASSYNEEEANGTTIQNSKSSYNVVKNNKNNYILGNNDNNDYSRNKNTNLRKTIKQKPNAPNESKLAALLKSMDESSDSESEEGSGSGSGSNGLANYKGSDTRNSNSSMFPPLPELNYKGPGSTMATSTSNENSKTLYSPDIPTSPQGAVSNNTYNDTPSTYANQYYKQFIPYLNQGSSEIPGQPKGELIEKINYIIDLLEDQQDYKTNSIFEDLILYAFLGIFVIFIVDSFAKSTKYVR